MAERRSAIETEPGTVRPPERAVQPLRQIGRRLLAQGADKSEFVVVENNADLVEEANRDGRLLGVAAMSPAISEVFNDLLIHGEGLDLVERPVRPHEVGKAPSECDMPVITVLRGGHALPYGQVPQLREGDQLVLVTSP